MNVPSNDTAMMEQKKRTYHTPQSELIAADETLLLMGSPFSEGDLGQVGTGDGTADPFSGL